MNTTAPREEADSSREQNIFLLWPDDIIEFQLINCASVEVHVFSTETLLNAVQKMAKSFHGEPGKWEQTNNKLNCHVYSIFIVSYNKKLHLQATSIIQRNIFGAKRVYTAWDLTLFTRNWPIISPNLPFWSNKQTRQESRLTLVDLNLKNGVCWCLITV